jgi:large subunit ribosomal protein L4
MSRLADITVVKAFGDTLQAPKTKEITAALQRLDIAPATRVLLVMDGASETLKLSVRNLERVKLIAADQLNVFDLLNAQKLVLNEGALAKIQEVYS